MRGWQVRVAAGEGRDRIWVSKAVSSNLLGPAAGGSGQCANWIVLDLGKVPDDCGHSTLSDTYWSLDPG